MLYLYSIISSPAGEGEKNKRESKKNEWVSTLCDQGAYKKKFKWSIYELSTSFFTEKFYTNLQKLPRWLVNTMFHFLYEKYWYKNVAFNSKFPLCSSLYSKPDKYPIIT